MKPFHQIEDFLNCLRSYRHKDFVLAQLPQPNKYILFHLLQHMVDSQWQYQNPHPVTPREILAPSGKTFSPRLTAKDHPFPPAQNPLYPDF